jgi:hypothetical protein
MVDGMAVLFSWFKQCKTTLSTVIKVGLCFNILTNKDNCSFTNWTSNRLTVRKTIQDFINHIISQRLHLQRSLPIITYIKSRQSHYKCSLSRHEMLHFLILMNSRNIRPINDNDRKVPVQKCCLR